MKTLYSSFNRLPIHMRLAIAVFGFLLVSLVGGNAPKASAEADPYPACGPAWNCVVPAGWVYPATGAPIRDLCPARKVLVPNASVLPAQTGLSGGGSSYTTDQSSVYMEIWYSVYICDGHPDAEESTSSVAWIVYRPSGTAINFGPHNNARDGNVGGNGGAWTGIGVWVPVNVGNNQVCHTVQGSITEAPGTFSNLGYCINVNRVTPISCSLTASPNPINAGGTSRLTWSTTGSPTSVSISPGIGAVGTSGFRDVAPAVTTTYTLTASKAGTTTRTCPRTVTVNPVAVPTVSCSSSPNPVNPNSTVRFSVFGTATGNVTWGGDTGTNGSPGTGTFFDTTYAASGPHTVNVTRQGVSNTCSVTVNVPPPPPIRPYLSVYGGDVQAGSGFGEGCTPTNGSAQILTFNQGSGIYQGAGTRMAAFALGIITQFVSANGTGTGAPKALSFSQTSGGTYGGNFGHTYCAPNYWAGVPATLPPLSLSAPILGEHKAVYWNGDVTITSNIVYPAWATLADIPSFYLIVKGGNIYIDKSVTQLDGVFIAMPDGATGGTIYTCTNGSTRYAVSIPAAAAPTGCGTTLTVNGAFIANQVKFLRTNGDINNATAAEIFNYGPELWVR